MKFPSLCLTILVIADAYGADPFDELLAARTRREKQVVTIHIRSEGCNPGQRPPCGRASIYVDDRTYYRRGHNVVVLDAGTGNVLEAQVFDTSGDERAGYKLRDYLNSITGKKIVLVAIPNGGFIYLSPAVDALKRLGATDPIVTDYGGSFTFVGYPEEPKPSWITQERRNSGEGPSVVLVQIPLLPTVSIYIRSEGCDDFFLTPPCRANIYVDGRDRSPHHRGHNVVVLDAATGKFLDAKAFDTFGDDRAGYKLRDYLNSITGQKIVLVAIQSGGSTYLSPAIDALRRLGATDPIATDYRGSFAFVGYPEVPKPSWVRQERRYSYQGPSVVSVQIPLSSEILNCFDADSSCECSEGAIVCIFNLEIDEIRTFTSYQKLAVDEPTGIVMRGVQGVSYYFDDSGTALPLQPNRECSTLESPKCTDPQFVDGKTYRLAIAVNGQIPGPTLMVHEEQIVVIHVHNNLTTEGISIHWHGMHQRGTPFFDGVGQVTQCQIGPSSTFSYVYRAKPPGTFWYHSHSGAQRTDGFYGALIVKESPDKMREIKRRLRRDFAIRDFEDFPKDHTISLLDWQEEPGLDLLSKVQGGVGFYPDTLPGEVPTPDDEKYASTVSADGAGVGPIPYFSGLINGKGRHVDIPYHKTRLSVFTVVSGNTYRFRLVGAQGLYAYRFSIDGHKLTVVGTDGYWIQPVKNVDYIIIHSGERYDFLVHAIKDSGDFWIRAETLEIDQTSGNVPYESLGHVAEAILHYRGRWDSGDSDIDVPSSEYAAIKNYSPPRECTAHLPCKAVNCPFLDFHSSYNINCFNVHNLHLLLPTPPEELPDGNPDDDCENCKFFINFSFEGDSDTSSVNGRNFILPSSPPQIQPEKFYADDTICNLTTNCNPFTPACSCAHVLDIPKDKTIQIVFSAIGIRDNAHPIHLHGHTFHVVHVGYPEYDYITGFITKHTSDIDCDDKNCQNEGCNQERCTRPSWKYPKRMKFAINNHTIRKDTVMLPAGGYVVINFLSDNPGWWFLHCHIEIHQLQGMALIVNEASNDQPIAPEGMKQCGNFEIPIEDFLSGL